MPADNKRIAKNTIFLYIRMMVMMFVSFFTSRVTLQALGVDDYGLMNTVGGIIGMMTFVNNALSVGSSRFLTFEMGTGDTDKLKRTFSTIFYAHLGMALLVVLVAETVGLWFLYNKVNIPPDRMDAAVFTYQVSILSCVVGITQVPYGAAIISHEKMSVYAYTSLIDVFAKLGVVYLIYISPFDKLKTYMTLYTSVGISMAFYFRYYCVRHFEEAKLRLVFDKQIMKSVATYSGWNLFANTSIALNTQGTIVLINMFFNSSVVAARAIANTVMMAAGQFVGNFRTAANPQIVKLYAAKDYEGSKRLLLQSTKFSFYLMFIFALPIFFVADPLLHIWLVEVPDYAVSFLQFAIATSLFQVFDTSFYTALYAKGQIRENALISPTVGFLMFPIIYLMFKFGASPISLAWAFLVDYAILGLIVKPILIVKIVHYTWKDVLSVFIPCLRVTVLAIPIPLLCYYFINNTWHPSIALHFIILTLVSVLSAGVSIWFAGMDSELRGKVISMIKTKFKR